MPDLNFRIEGAEPQRHAAEPSVAFKLHVSEAVPHGMAPTSILAVAMRCRISAEPGRRRYSDTERARLVDLFGAPERWGQTLRPLPWTQVGVVLPSFAGEVTVEMPVLCSFDFSLAATRYFAALEGGDLPVCVLFSGTVFYESAEQGALQVTPISWDKEATFRLPAATWQELRDVYYPNVAWLSLRRDVFDALSHYKARCGLPNWESTLERLLAAAEQPVAP